MRLSATRLFIGAILAGQFMANVDTAIINIATPSIGATLHASGAELQLAVTVYVLATAMLLITAARLGTLFGYRRLFLAGLVTFTAASLGCGLAPDILSLIGARIVQGAGAALMIAQVLTGIQRTLTGDARTRAIGAYTMTLSLAAVLGQILGGVLITINVFGLTWRPLFLINVPIGIALALLAWRVMPRDEPAKGPRPTLDLVGVGLLGLTMLLFILPLTIGREMHWPWWAIASFVASVAGAATFIKWQQRLGREHRGPLLNLALFHQPVVVTLIVAQLFGRLSYFSLLFVLAIYVQTGLGETALVSALSLLAWVAAYGLGGPIYPRLPKRIAPWCSPAGGALVVLAYGGTAIATANHAGTGALLTTLLGFGGLGFGLFQTATTSQLTSVIPKERAPDLSGVIATMTPISAVTGIAVFGSGYLVLAAPGGAAAAMHAFAITNAAFATTAVISTVLVTALTLGSERVRARGQKSALFDLVEKLDGNRDRGVA